MYRRYFVAVCLLLVWVTAIIGRNTAYADPPPLPPNALDRQLLLPLPDHTSSSLQDPQFTPNTPIIPWSKMVSQSYRDNNWEIYLSNDDGSGSTRLTNHNRSDIHPYLNRGATQIVFASNRGDGDFEIYKMNISGGNLTPLTNNSADDGNPIWSPSGTKVVFESYRDGQAEIYVMNADGSGQIRLTNGGSYNGMPMWSPDSSKIAFVSYRTGGYLIWVMNADGSSQTQLSDQAYSFHPTWSPDGTKIAYDAAGVDGWQNLWLMNANGTDQHLVYDPQLTFDAWPRSWSPNGRYVAFTEVYFVDYQGQWYWSWAGQKAYDIFNQVIALNDTLYDWFPHWQTVDNQSPTASVTNLPNQSPGPFLVQWSGSDIGGSGLQNYDVQIKVGTGNWSDWRLGTTATSAQYPGIGGQTYAFRARARDNAYNVQAWPTIPNTLTMVESWPPVTTVTSPPYRRVDNPIIPTWSGYDPGNSGIASYDIRYKINNGSWINWQDNTTSTSASITTGNAGQTLTFQSRAIDRAQNEGNWPSGSDGASTILYTWRLIGHLYDNTGTPISNALVNISAPTFSNSPSNNEGEYAVYTQNSQVNYTTTWNKPGYGSIPPTQLPLAIDGQVNGILPPVDNIISNGDFESGNLQPEWIGSGTITATINGHSHSGAKALILGQEGTDLAAEMKMSTNGNWNYSHNIMVDQLGRLHLIWLEGTNRLFYKWRSIDGVWHSGATLNDSRLGGWNVDADIDGNGIIHVAWEGNDFDVYYAQLDTKLASSHWSNPINISHDSDWSRYPDLDVNSQGDVHIGWVTGIPGSASTNVAYSYRLNSGTWNMVQIFNPSDRDNSPALKVAENGTVHMMWLTQSPSNSGQIIYLQRSPDGTWSDMTNVAQGQTTLSNPRMIIDDKGAVHIAWVYDSDNSSGVYYSYRSSAHIWSAPERISSIESGQLSPIVIDPEGGLHAVWTTYEGNVYYAYRDNHGTWYDPLLVEQSNLNERTSTSVSVGRNGRVHIIRGGDYDSGPTNTTLYYLHRLADGTWTTSQNIGDNINDNVLPNIIVDDLGSVHIVWTKRTDTSSDIYYIGPSFVQETDISQITQYVTIPLTITTPILSFVYQLEGAAAGSSLTVHIDDGNNVTSVADITTNTNNWTHEWIDLTSWRGQPISITFGLIQAAGTPIIMGYLDEITVGSAYPDLWLDDTYANALPGETVVQKISYGNRGGATAVTNLITLTLPVGLSFVSASIPLLTTSPNLIVWQVNDLPAKGNPHTIEVALMVAESAAPFTTLTSMLEIGTDGVELELLNNYAEASTFIGRFIYLPFINKN